MKKIVRSRDAQTRRCGKIIGLSAVRGRMGEMMRVNRRNESHAARGNVACEALERRRMLNVDLSYNGSAGDDVYTVRLKAGDPSTLEVVESIGGGAPVTHSTPVAEVDSVTIRTQDGFDLLIVDETNGPIVLDWNINYEGGDDFDELRWECADGADDVEIYNGSIITNELTVLIFDDFIEEITINCNGGDDVISLDSTDPFTSWIINGGDGNDFLDFSSDSFEVIEGDITFNGGAGADVIHADDSFPQFSDDYYITSTTLTRDFFVGLTFSDIEVLLLDAQPGGNNIFVNGTPAGATVTINGGGGNDTLFINAAPSGPLLFNGGLNPANVDSLIVNAGTYTFNSDARDGTANLAVTVNSGGVVVFNASQHLKSLTIDGGSAAAATNGSRVIVTETINVQGNGKLDLRDNDLIVRDGSLAADVHDMISSGRNGGAWNGSGIVTGMSSAISPQILTTLGVASASQVLGIAAAQTGVWQGETVNGAAVLVKYTYGGDANLSGGIDADDYFAIDSNYNNGGGALYFEGDFDYSGAIDGDDFHIIDINFGPAGAGGLLAPVVQTVAAPSAGVWFISDRATELIEEDRVEVEGLVTTVAPQRRKG